MKKTFLFVFFSTQTDQTGLQRTVTDTSLTPSRPPYHPALKHWPTLCSAVTLSCHNLLTPTPISKITPPLLHQHHLLIITRSAARVCCKEMAACQAFHLDKQSHTSPGLNPFIYTHIGICAHADTHEHRSRNTRFHLLLDVTPLLVSSPTPFSACCWHHCVNKNTIFLSSSPGHAVPFISLFLLRALREWLWGPGGIWDTGELWETRV